MAVGDKTVLAPAGSTGNNTHAAVNAPPMAANVAFQFVVEAAGATPTVTFKFQGSLDGTNWYDLDYVTDAVDTGAVAARTVTAVGAYAEFVQSPLQRAFTQYRCVTSANTNITYRAEMFEIK